MSINSIKKEAASFQPKELRHLIAYIISLQEKLNLLGDIQLLEINRSIQEIVDVYISNYLMPKDHLGDALHLAIASHHKMDFLLTWNCNHLANANKRSHIRRINERLKIFTPELVTPYELMEEE